jgi:thioredoxin-related protein
LQKQLKKSFYKMNNRLFWVIIFTIIGNNLSFAQDALQWTTLENAEALAAKTGKKIMIKAYTDWCGWCKVMDKETFPDQYVSKVLNDNYVSVRFNTEKNTDVSWGGVPYKLVKNERGGAYHELAVKWLGSKMTFPTIVILDAKGNLIQAIPGYRKPLEFEQILAYFAGDFQNKMEWGKFQEQYKH